jgi:hypothetical protein
MKDQITKIACSSSLSSTVEINPSISCPKAPHRVKLYPPLDTNWIIVDSSFANPI